MTVDPTVFPPPSQPQYGDATMVRGEDKQYPVCEHDWPPEPNADGVYVCAKCTAYSYA